MARRKHEGTVGWIALFHLIPYQLVHLVVSMDRNPIIIVVKGEDFLQYKALL